VQERPGEEDKAERTLREVRYALLDNSERDIVDPRRRVHERRIRRRLPVVGQMKVVRVLHRLVALLWSRDRHCTRLHTRRTGRVVLRLSGRTFSRHIREREACCTLLVNLLLCRTDDDERGSMNRCLWDEPVRGWHAKQAGDEGRDAEEEEVPMEARRLTQGELGALCHERLVADVSTGTIEKTRKARLTETLWSKKKRM
jgi:hypothetical protein